MDRREEQRQFQRSRRERQPWRAWYSTARWQKLRKSFLDQNPFCVMCRADGLTREANVCDHIHQHHGDPDKFWSGPFQPLCTPCHSGRKQAAERRGYEKGSDADGRPTDPSHPWNR